MTQLVATSWSSRGHDLVKSGESFRDFSAISGYGIPSMLPYFRPKRRQKTGSWLHRKKPATTGVKRRLKIQGGDLGLQGSRIKQGDLSRVSSILSSSSFATIIEHVSHEYC